MVNKPINRVKKIAILMVSLDISTISWHLFWRSLPPKKVSDGGFV